MSNGSTWSRLRWPVKALIVGIPLVGLIWYGSQNEKIKEKLAATDEVTTSEVVTDGSKKESSENNTAGSSEHRTFAYQPEKPVNGELKGVVEVGASGFNSFVVKIDKEKRWEVVSKEFGNSMVYEGLATA
ncbi:MAG TPA: hypothetical protein VL943_08980, partial [Niabella sp.]|nr:hypothetical protein [Niabella sp.]